MKKLLSILGEFMVASTVGLAVAWLIIWAIDEEERQVKAGIKDPNSTILPVIDYAAPKTTKAR